jgi:hypothetical protein
MGNSWATAVANLVTKTFIYLLSVKPISLYENHRRTESKKRSMGMVDAQFEVMPYLVLGTE